MLIEGCIKFRSHTQPCCPCSYPCRAESICASSDDNNENRNDIKPDSNTIDRKMGTTMPRVYTYFIVALDSIHLSHQASIPSYSTVYQMRNLGQQALDVPLEMLLVASAVTCDDSEPDPDAVASCCSTGSTKIGISCCRGFGLNPALVAAASRGPSLHFITGPVREQHQVNMDRQQLIPLT